ncbi:hypothetical protein BGZ54_008071 [Gamsiella multidivaricata]|nr:hypothetical protein BGZ54_008071 [Gamsiella multidivaricata]
MLSDLETAAMQDLDALEELTLQQWDVSKGRLVQVLKRNRRSLVRLNLRGIQGFDSLYDENKDSQSELSSQEETRLSKGYQKHGNERNEQDREVLVMDHLKELTVDCEWVENRALLDFVTQCCPNLERLRLSYDLAHDTSMMDKLDAKLATQHRVSVKTTLGDVQYQFVAERY